MSVERRAAVTAARVALSSGVSGRAAGLLA